MLKPMLAGLAIVAGTAVSVLAHASAHKTATPSPEKTGVRVVGAMVSASSAGAVLDSDLLRGGGTDDTSTLQKLLDVAKTGRAVHLLIDGPALVSGLNVYGHTTIECTAGGGLYLKDNSDRALLRNAHRSRGAVSDKHITLRGCFLNGNRNGQRQASGPLFGERQEADGTLKSTLQFFGVSNLTMESVFLWDCRAFCAQLANAKFITIRDATIDANFPPYPENASATEQRKYLDAIPRSFIDGFHFHGPIQYLTMDGLKLRTEDDALAFTANEYKDDITIDNPLGPYVGQGPITDVIISNVILMDALQGIRLLSSTERIDRFVVSNVTGTVRHRMAVISPFTAASRGNVGSVSFSHIHVDQLSASNWRELYPDWYQEDLKTSATWDRDEEGEAPIFSLNGSIESLTLNDVVTKAINPRPIIRVGHTSRINRMRVDLSVKDPKAQAIPLKLNAGSHIERLNLSLDWQGDGQQGKEPIVNNGGTIEQTNWANPTHLPTATSSQ